MSHGREIIHNLLQQMTQAGAADLHLGGSKTPRIRTDEALIPMDHPVLSNAVMEEILQALLNEEQLGRFRRDRELDFAMEIPGMSRFRCNCYFQRGRIGLNCRRIADSVMPLNHLGLPADLLKSICHKTKGLVLITGATGAGKTTTLASMVDYINRTKAIHIVTIEDPIEYVFQEDRARINQREVGSDTLSFAQGLKYVLRQDPDVILIGEMRDLETIQAALTIAETGHLVLATLHTSDVTQTINRVVDVFPASQQNQVRLQLSFELLAVICQQLVPKSTGKGRVLASEVMIATHATRALIREQRLHQIYSTVQTSRKEGMHTMNHSLMQLVKAKQVAREVALARTADPAELARMLEE